MQTKKPSKQKSLPGQIGQSQSEQQPPPLDAETKAKGMANMRSAMALLKTIFLPERVDKLFADDLGIREFTTHFWVSTLAKFAPETIAEAVEMAAMENPDFPPSIARLRYLCDLVRIKKTEEEADRVWANGQRECNLPIPVENFFNSAWRRGMNYLAEDVLKSFNSHGPAVFPPPTLESLQNWIGEWARRNHWDRHPRYANYRGGLICVPADEEFTVKIPPTEEQKKAAAGWLQKNGWHLDRLEMVGLGRFHSQSTGAI